MPKPALSTGAWGAGFDEHGIRRPTLAEITARVYDNNQCGHTPVCVCFVSGGLGWASIWFLNKNPS
jgi:hypothetical protein